MVGTSPRTPPAEDLNPDDAVGPGGGGGGGGDQLNPLQPPGPPLGQLQQGQQPGQIPPLQVPQGPLANPQDVYLMCVGYQVLLLPVLVPVPLLLRFLLWILVREPWTRTSWPATSPRCYYSVCLGW